MNDLQWAAAWALIFGLGLAFCVALHRAGVATSRVRDLLHVGAGSWALGWPAWHARWPPILIASLGLATLLSVPLLAPRVPFLARVQAGVSDGDERWAGLWLFALAATGLTVVAMTGHPFPAAAGLWALALGDGVGGALGKQFGRTHYRVPWAKRKSLEGTAAVALFAWVGIALARLIFHGTVGEGWLLGAAVLAAAAEAVAPRASDNVLVPACVTALLLLAR